MIIDEWDVLIRDEAAKEDIKNEYIRFLRGIFKGTEPQNIFSLHILQVFCQLKGKNSVCLKQF